MAPLLYKMAHNIQRLSTAPDADVNVPIGGVALCYWQHTPATTSVCWNVSAQQLAATTVTCAALPHAGVMGTKVDRWVLELSPSWPHLLSPTGPGSGALVTCHSRLGIRI